MHNIQEARDDEFIHVDTHISTTGIFDTSETRARGSRYGVSGIPDVWFDGLVRVTGAGSCSSAEGQYNSRIDSRLTATGGVTPIDLSVEMSISGDVATITGSAELVDDIVLSGLQMTLFLVEGEINHCCDVQGGDVWYDVTRSVRSTPITLVHDEAPVEVIEVVDFTALPSYSGPPVDPQELYAVAVVEFTGGTEEIFQAAAYHDDLNVAFDQVVASVPEGNGEILLTGKITNGNEDADDFDVVAAGEPAWNYTFQLDGDPNWYDSSEVTLGPGAEAGFTLRVNTNGEYGIGQARLEVSAHSSSFATSGIMRVFNGSHACLVVDADNSGTYEAPFQLALENLGQLYDTHTSTSGGGPLANAMVGYDLVVWETGYISNPMQAERGLAIQEYLSSGGSLLLESMDWTQSPANTAELRALLGVESYDVDTRANEANGVGGDPISDGMFYSLTFPTQAANRVDRIYPTSSAATVFENESGEPNVVRNEIGRGGRAVFSTIEQGVYDGADAPVEVASAMIAWLLSGEDPTDVRETDRLVSGSLQAHPNPSRLGTEISFGLSASAAGAPVRLDVIAPSGREVRSLIRGRLDSGLHELVWNGRDDNGYEVANGLYFARLRTADRESRTKIIRLR